MIIVVCVGSLVPVGPDIPIVHGDKWGHLFAYGLLVVWWSMLHRSATVRWMLCGAFVAMGVALELAQGAIGFRTCDPLDMLANAGGAVAGRLAVATPIGRLFPALHGQLSGRR